MITQKEALVDVLTSTRQYLAEVAAGPTPKHDRAKGVVMSLLNKRIASVNKQIDKYEARYEASKAGNRA